MLAEDEAVAAVRAVRGEPDGGRLTATAQTSLLWSVVAVDPEGRPFTGGGCLVGPDARLWPLSGSPVCHDWALAIDLLDRLYLAGLADAFDADGFADRVHRLTRARAELVEQVLDDARTVLRRRAPQHLP